MTFQTVVGWLAGRRQRPSWYDILGDYFNSWYDYNNYNLGDYFNRLAAIPVVGWPARRRQRPSWYDILGDYFNSWYDYNNYNLGDYFNRLAAIPGTYVCLAVICSILLFIYFIFLERRDKRKEKVKQNQAETPTNNKEKSAEIIDKEAKEEEEKANAEDNKGDKKESFPPVIVYCESPTHTCTCRLRALKMYAEEVFVEKVVESVLEKVMDKMNAEKAETEFYRMQIQNFLADAKKADVEATTKTPLVARRALSCSGYLALLDPENKEKGRQVEIKEKQRNRNQPVYRNLSVYRNQSVYRKQSVKPNKEDRWTKTKKVRSTDSNASVGWQFKNVLPQVAKSRKLRKKESAFSLSSRTMKGRYYTSNQDPRAPIMQL